MTQTLFRSISCFFCLLFVASGCAIGPHSIAPSTYAKGVDKVIAVVRLPEQNAWDKANAYLQTVGPMVYHSERLREIAVTVKDTRVEIKLRAVDKKTTLVKVIAREQRTDAPRAKEAMYYYEELIKALQT